MVETVKSEGRSEGKMTRMREQRGMREGRVKVMGREIKGKRQGE